MAEQHAQQRRTVYYSGRVQGVGFRYTTVAIARRFDVVGHVENLPDGRVKLVAEGDSNEIDAFCGEIDRALGDKVVERMVDRRPATGEFSRFDVKH